MGRWQKYYPFFAAALLLYVALLIIYPHYQYYIDPDGTAYLTISKRYAAGDIQRAINGYWSPWACWLTAGLIRCGFAAIPASVIINTLGATGFLFISQSFFLKFGIIRKTQWLLDITLAFFLCYAIFWQSFDDLWECFFLLCTLRVMLAESFKHKPGLWVLTGLIGTLAYFAKAYSFPFFILNTICCTFFITKDNKALWLKMSFVSIGTMILCSLPWVWALHDKYGIWTTSTSGSLNMSWYLVGHPHWKAGIDVLLPPPYPDSPYYWEDPWFVNGDTPHFWDSWHLLGLQILRLGYNVFKLLRSMLQLSIVFPLIAIAAWLSFRSGKWSALFVGDMKIVILSFLLFPLGYLLVNFESRYIWYMLPLGMVMVALWLQNNSGKSRQRLLLILVLISFLVYPVWQMRNMYDEGSNEHIVTEQLREMNIQGSFASITKAGPEVQRTERLAYFSGNQFYSVGTKNVSEKNLLKEMSRYHVKYYFTFDTSHSGNFVDEGERPLPVIIKGSIEGLKVFQFNQ